MAEKTLKQLPENWTELSHIDQMKFFCRFYAEYGRGGEVLGLRDFAPEEVKKAYEEWLKEEDDYGQA